MVSTHIQDEIRPTTSRVRSAAKRSEGPDAFHRFARVVRIIRGSACAAPAACRGIARRKRANVPQSAISGRDRGAEMRLELPETARKCHRRDAKRPLQNEPN